MLSRDYNRMPNLKFNENKFPPSFSLPVFISFLPLVAHLCRFLPSFLSLFLG
jgi:hypothetical protein